MTTNGARLTVTQSGEFVQIRAGEAPDGLFGSTLMLPGGVVTFDVRNLDLPPSASVNAPGVALPWIVRVYGEPARDKITTDHLAADIDAMSGEVAWAPTADAGTLARIALGQWFLRFWPATTELKPLDEPLLRLELAALSWGVDECFTVLQPASAFLRGQLATLKRLAVDLAELPATTLDTPLGRVVLGALDAAVDSPGVLASDDLELLDELDVILNALVASTGSTRPPDDGHDPAKAADDILQARAAGLEQLRATSRRSDFALIAGADDQATGERPATAFGATSSVDWAQVPARILDWREGKVRWSAKPVAGVPATWEVTVRVAAAPVAVDDAQPVVLARGYVLGESAVSRLPILTIVLERDGDEYRGTGTVAAPDVTDLVIDVFAASSMKPPLLAAADREEARLERGEARAFIQDRDAGEVKGGPDSLFVWEQEARD